MTKQMIFLLPFPTATAVR